MTIFNYATLDDVAHAQDCVVVIDVLRAYTTAAVALSQGAGPYELVSTLEEAYQRREDVPGVVLMGEVGGVIAEGFDLPNSPSDVAKLQLSGVPVVHRSSAGTQGAVRAVNASRVLASSFVVAGATATALRGEPSVTFCVTGDRVEGDGDEDRACGNYLQAILEEGGTVDPTPYLQRVKDSQAGYKVANSPGFPPEDVPFAMQLDLYDFALSVTRDDGDRVWLSRLDPSVTPHQ